MAKELGMIHTLNYDVKDIQNDGDKAILDLSGLASAQLQHQVRQGNYFKLTGLDITLSDFGTGEGGGQLSGRIEYWSPNRGRCAAYRSSFQSMREAFKRQGISMRDNPAYDFRPMWDDEKDYLTVTTDSMADYSEIIDNATLDGNEKLVLINGAEAGYEIFTTHNKSVTPTIGGFIPPHNFQTGFKTGVNDGNDFVFNDNKSRGYQANPEFANTDCESIPFQLSYSPGSSDISVQFNWRPDPQLFMACAFGMLRVVVDELDTDDDANALRLNIAVHIAGWKSIMGDPDAKKNRRRRSKSLARTKSNQSMTETTVTTVKKS